MIEADFYRLNCGREIKNSQMIDFFQSIEGKGYLVSDLGVLSGQGMIIEGIRYDFNEANKVPVKGNKLGGN